MHKSPKNPKTPKDKAWQAFSRLRRVTHCLETTGLPFVGLCITCQKQYHLDYLDAGHCYGGRSNSKLLLAKFVFNQCQYCNRVMHGQAKKYKKVVREMYGDAFCDRAEQRMTKVIQDKNIDWSGREARYKRKLDKVMREHGYKTYGEILRMGR